MGGTADHKHRKRLTGRAFWLTATLLWCATTGAAPVYTLQVDSANSFVKVEPVWIFPPPEEGPPFPDPLSPTRYAISGTLEIISFEPSEGSSANVRIRAIEIHADPVLLPDGGLFVLPEGLPGRWEGTAIQFSDNGCDFRIFTSHGFGLCAGLSFAFASGTFDGEHLDLAGTPGLFGPEYRIVADIVHNSQVPEPTTFSLMLLGLAFAALRIRKRGVVSGGLAARHARQARTQT